MILGPYSVAAPLAALALLIPALNLGQERQKKVKQ